MNMVKKDGMSEWGNTLTTQSVEVDQSYRRENLPIIIMNIMIGQWEERVP